MPSPNFLDDSELEHRVDRMAANFGGDYQRRPNVGCGSRFVPEAKGASMVVEFKMKDGSWEASLSERIPPDARQSD